MRFIAYPTGADRRVRERGRVVDGEVVDKAPPSGLWVWVAAEGKYYRVFGSAIHGPGGDGHLKSAIDTEAYVPRAKAST